MSPVFFKRPCIPRDSAFTFPPHKKQRKSYGCLLTPRPFGLDWIPTLWPFTSCLITLKQGRSKCDSDDTRASGLTWERGLGWTYMKPRRCCDACRRRHRKCVVQSGAAGCGACIEADLECHFDTTLRFKHAPGSARKAAGDRVQKTDYRGLARLSVCK